MTGISHNGAVIVLYLCGALLVADWFASWAAPRWLASLEFRYGLVVFGVAALSLVVSTFTDLHQPPEMRWLSLAAIWMVVAEVIRRAVVKRVVARRRARANWRTPC